MERLAYEQLVPPMFNSSRKTLPVHSFDESWWFVLLFKDQAGRHSKAYRLINLSCFSNRSCIYGVMLKLCFIKLWSPSLRWHLELGNHILFPIVKITYSYTDRSIDRSKHVTGQSYIPYNKTTLSFRIQIPSITDMMMMMIQQQQQQQQRQLPSYAETCVSCKHRQRYD